MKPRTKRRYVAIFRLTLLQKMFRRESWYDMLRGFDKQSNNRMMRQAMQEEALYEFKQAVGL